MLARCDGGVVPACCPYYRAYLLQKGSHLMGQAEQQLLTVVHDSGLQLVLRSSNATPYDRIVVASYLTCPES